MTKEKIIAWCDRFINWLFVGIIFLTPIYFAYFAENYNVFELNKLLIVRGGVSLILFLWLIKTALAGKIVYYNKRLWFAAAAVLAVYIFPGVVFSAKPTLSWWGNYDRQQGVYSLIYYWLFFVLFLLNIKAWAQVKMLIASALAASALVSVYGIIQHFNLDPQKWMTDVSRAFSSLGQPNFLGHYLVMVIPLTISGWWLFKSPKKYYYLPLLLISQLACLLFTFSRSAWLGFALSVLVVVVMLLTLKIKRKTILLSLIILLFIFGGGFLYGLNNSKSPINSYYQRFISSFQVDTGSNKARLVYWAAVGQEFQQTNWRHRLFGFGKDTQGDIFVRHYDRNWVLSENLNSFPDRAHNLILDIWLEFGLIGLAVLATFSLYLLIKAFAYLLRHRQNRDNKFYLLICLMASLFAYFFTALFGFPLTTHYLYYYWLLGLLAWLLFSQDEWELNLNKLSLAFKWTITVIVISFVAFFYYLLTIKPFIADCFYMLAKRSEVKVECAKTLYYANRMLDIWPSSLKLKEQYVFLNINCLPFLVDKSDVIVLMNNVLNVIDSYPPQEVGYPILMEQAHAYSVFGHYLDAKYYKQAEDFYLAIIKLSPDITVTYQDYARMKMWAGDYDSAVRIVNQGLAALPISISLSHQIDVDKQKYTFYDLLGKIYIQKNDLPEALKYFKLAQAANPREVLIYQKLSDLSWRLKQTKEAFDWLEKGKQISPAENAWDYNEALYYLEQKKMAEALTAAKRALELKPEDKIVKQLVNSLIASNKAKP